MVVVSLQAHDMLGHLLRRVGWTCWVLEMRMSAQCRAHMRHLLVLGLLWTRRMHYISSLAQLLQVFLQAQLGISQLVLRGWWCAILIRVLTWPSAHLRVGIRVTGHVGARRIEERRWMVVVCGL